MRLEKSEKAVKVVIDTNIAISAAIVEDGNPAKIFELLLLEKIENYTTAEICLEIVEVFHRPKILKSIDIKDIKFILINYQTFSKTVFPKQKFQVVKNDPKDNKFLDCAVEAKADYIITGDPDLLELKRFRGIEIITPKNFIALLF